VHRSRSSSARRHGAALLCLPLLALAACSDGGDGEEASPATAPPATAPTPSTSAAPTTTRAPATTAPATTTTTTEPATTTTVPAPPVYPLTGVLLDDPAALARPALVVKIDNAPGARPQTGFNAADIVFEEIVNDNLTRFAMVFHSQGSDPVGPVRSGRLQDVDLFGGLNRPLFAWSGGNATVTDAIRSSDLVELGPSTARGAYFRSRDRRAPHNLYTNTSQVWALAPEGSAAPAQQFSYRSADAPVPGTPSPGVAMALDAVDVRWDWDAEQGLYVRTMEGRPHLDAATGTPITTNNVVVLNMEYVPGISGSPDARSVSSGEAFVLTGGGYVHGTWTRTDRLEPFVLTADDGSVIQLQPGRTFVELPRPNSTIVLPPA